MRKIVPKTEEAKKKKKNQFVVGGILVFLMVSSIVGYSFQGRTTGSAVNENNKIIFNGFEFTEQNGFWILDFRGNNLIFKYNPKEIKQTEFFPKDLESYMGKPLYIYSENIRAEFEIKNNLGNFADSIENACPVGEDCGEGVVEKDCTENFIIIKEDNKGEVSKEGNCILIKGSGENLIKTTDEFLFKTFGVI